MWSGSEFDYLRPFETELVRVGPKGDCGYVIPKSAAISTRSLYSIGISTNWEFEVEMSRLNPGLNISAFDRTSGWKVFAYVALRDLLKGDPSVVGGQPLIDRVLSFRKFLVLAIRFRSFFRGRRRFNRKWVRVEKRGSDEVSFKESIAGAFIESPSMLKIDIEGGEYEFIDDLLHQLSENHQRVSCLVMELHDTHTRRVDFERLVKGILHWLPIVHIHANNCAGVAADGLPEVLEITFARSEREIGNREFPLLHLDYPNDPNIPDISFAFAQTGES
ncbi:MAG: hypothetical protein RLZ02_159 [Actinomycetota bacterium]|jgi:hypothetical protein